MKKGPGMTPGPSNYFSIWLFYGVRLDLGHCPDRIAHLEPRKAAHAQVLTQLADLLRNQVLDGEGLVLDERLVEQANFFVKLAHLAFHNLLDHRRRLPGGRSLRTVNVLLPLQILVGHILPADVPGIGRRDVHGDILEQLLEVLRARYKIALAVDFNQHADLAASVNIGADSTFRRVPRRLLGS